MKYYNYDKEITSEEAHALKDKRYLIVSPITYTATELKKLNADRYVEPVVASEETI